MSSLDDLIQSDDEEKVWTFQKEQTVEPRADLALFMVGRLLINKSIRSLMIKEKMATVWQPRRKASIKEVDKGVYVCQFFHKQNMQKVVTSGP